MKEKERTLKNVLIYCRESRDDGFVNYERIETQKDILVAFCKDRKLGNIIGIIMDDNKSGVDFERLEPIKERIRNNEVDILLLKDASRLGRNVLESLTFTDFLEKYKVELVFESEQYDEDMFPLIAWFNERRAKDDSVKIRRVLKHKMEEGEIVIKAPYGYIKQGNRLVIDEVSAAVVNEIFDLFIKGFSKNEIASIINKKRYPTPSQLKEQYKKTNCAEVWNNQHIDRILNHLAYTGDMPYGMRKKISFKTKKYQNVDKKDWIIVPNHHEAIISREIFEEAQERLKINKRIRTRNPSENIFSGLLFCGRCGGPMYRKAQKGKKPWYSCRKSDREGTAKDPLRPNYGCSSHRIREFILIEIIKDYIVRLTDEFQDAISLSEKNPENKRTKVQDAKKRMERLKAKASRVYEDRLEDRLPEYLFKEKLEEITNELTALESGLQEMEKNMAKEIEYGKGEFTELTNRLHENGVNGQSLKLLFKKIIVFNPKDIKTEASKRYDISDEDRQYLFENGGVLFIQNFIFKTTICKEAAESAASP